MTENKINPNLQTIIDKLASGNTPEPRNQSLTSILKTDENGKPIKGIARHPIVEDEVIIYSNATILGRITVGKGAVVGGNKWITQDIPAASQG